ncbi:MAG: hypothetical protein AAF750_07395 [Planctomycetota bacterium]
MKPMAGRPALIIAEDTTVFLGPVRDDGTIDYVAAWNAKFGEGVTPQNNAAAALFTLMRRPLHSDDYEHRLALRLGVDPVIESRSIEPWPNYPEDEQAKRQFDEATNGPWRAMDLPLVTDWLDKNNAVLDAVHLAVDRPRFWWPMMNTEGERSSMDEVVLPQLGEARFLARSLRARSFQQLAAGNLDGAIKDLQSIQRLGRLIGAEPIVINRLVDVSIQALAFDVAEALLAWPGLTREHALAISDSIPEPLPFDYARGVIMEGSRLVALEHLIDLHAGVHPKWGPTDKALRLAIRSARFDINQALRRTTALYRDIVAIEPTSLVEADRLTENINQQHGGLAGLYPHTFRQFGQGRDLSEWAADQVATWYAAGDANQFRTRLLANGSTARIRLAAALRLYRFDRGSYPQRLDALVPDYLAALPVDEYDGRPLTYKPGENGKTYLLYSVGPNGKDDGGVDNRSDGDLVIGDPVPARE